MSLGGASFTQIRLRPTASVRHHPPALRTATMLIRVVARCPPSL